MYKLYIFYIQNSTSNPNQSPLLQQDLMDPNLVSTEVLIVAMLGRMKLERKKLLALQCFVLSHACGMVGL